MNTPSSNKTTPIYLNFAENPMAYGKVRTIVTQSITTSSSISKYLLEVKSSATASSTDSSESTAGGRHDNEFPDFREIAILPTSDEFESAVPRNYYSAAVLRNSWILVSPGTIGLQPISIINSVFCERILVCCPSARIPP